MQASEKRKIIALILLFAALLTLVWIFGNSLRNGEQSSAQSNRFLKLIRPFAERALELFGIKPSEQNLSHYVRKAAHFSEYALFGFLLTCSLRLLWYPDRKKVLFVFPICLLCAAADETIQSFTPGRAASAADVLLDFCGAVFGIGCACLLLLLLSAILKKKNGSMG